VQAVESSEMLVDSFELLGVLILLNFKVNISMKQKLTVTVHFDQLIVKTVQKAFHDNK
jgi:hypothetical protein